MPPFKLTPSQHAKVMNHPIHYNLASVRYDEKANMFVCEATPGDLMVIKGIVDEPVTAAAPAAPEVGKLPQADNEDTPMAGFIVK